VKVYVYIVYIHLHIHTGEKLRIYIMCTCTLLYILTFGTHAKFVQENNMPALGVCVPQPRAQGACVGRCHWLPSLHALIFAMGTHARLGSVAPTAVPAGGSSRRSRRLEGKEAGAADYSTGAYVTMLGKLVQRMVEAGVSWPEGKAGNLEGVVQLLGGMIKNNVLH